LHGFDDIIGVASIAAALLLMIAQFSFDANDLSSHINPPNKPAHNWIGPSGAGLAHSSFQCLGAAAYLVPFLLTAFGLSHFLKSLTHLRARQNWMLLWCSVMMVSLTGLLHLLDNPLQHIKESLDAPSAGGWLGYLPYTFGFWALGNFGATIVHSALLLISVLFLTNFRLGDWVRRLPIRKNAAGIELSDEEMVLERKLQETRKQREKLEREPGVSTNSGLGADGQPVPEPTIRDLSVPQPKPRGRKNDPSEPSQDTHLAEGVEVISARELAAADSSAASERKQESTTEATVHKNGDSPANGPDSSTLMPRTRPTLKRKPVTVASVPMIGNYKLPTLEFLQHADMTAKPTESKEELMANARLMQQTLTQFQIEVSLGDITKGPTITRYELHPAPGVKLEKIVNLSNNIAAALKAERINILAPVPGKSSVGVEVPNLIKTKVIMRDLFESDEWRNTKARIPIALGKDVYGQPIIADLAEMPHLLIAGSTGSGKSVCINSIIASLLYRFTPDQMRFVMIDPKVVELQLYNVLPHLVVPVVTDAKKVILALRWVINEMEKRYQIFARVGIKNIKSFNERPKNNPLPIVEPELPLTAKKEKVEPGADGFAVEVDEEIVVPREDEIVIPEKLSYIVVIIDELADLMLVAPAEVEMAIARITQMARAAGIHCIVATQRPSVDVITGVIKSNIPARIAFQVAAAVDSRTILDAKGADKLLGKGDMLYLPPGSANLKRAQGALITDQEIQSAVDFIAKQGKPSYELEIHKQLAKSTGSMPGEGGINEDEELIENCIEVIRSEQKASVSLLQRRLKLGYGRAARIMDELENRGIVGPNKGAEPRDILIDLDGGGADGAGQ